MNLVLHGQLVRLRRHRHGDARLRRSAATDVPRQRRACDRARHFNARGGNVLALGDNIKREMVSITNGLPIRIEPILVADQPYVVSHAVGDFMQSLVEALVIVIAISFLSLGLRAGAVVALSIPVVLATVFIFMDLSDIALQRVSLGALIISLGLLVDDAMITVEMMIRKLEEGWTKAKAATHAYADDSLSDGHRHAGDRGGIPPDRHGPELCRRVPVFAVRSGRRRAHRLLVRRRHLQRRCSASCCSRRSTAPVTNRDGDAGFRAILLLCMRWRRATVALACVAFIACHGGARLRAAAVLSIRRPARAFRRHAAAAERVDCGDGEGHFRARAAAAPDPDIER